MILHSFLMSSVLSRFSVFLLTPLWLQSARSLRHAALDALTALVSRHGGRMPLAAVANALAESAALVHALCSGFAVMPHVVDNTCPDDPITPALPCITGERCGLANGIHGAGVLLLLSPLFAHCCTSCCRAHSSSGAFVGGLASGPRPCPAGVQPPEPSMHEVLALMGMFWLRRSSALSSRVL